MMYSAEELQGFENKILNMDCLDFLKKCPDNYFSLVLTDPPYGINAGKNIRKDTQHGKALCKSGLNYVAKNWDNGIPSNKIFNEIFRVSKNQIIWGGNYFVEYLQNSPCWIVWDKVTGNNCYADCELAYTNFPTAVRQFTYMWKGMFQENMKEKEIRIHPTQKPLPLFQWCLNNYSKEGDLILDCFSGSGTTAVACHNLHRRFICIEKDPDYWKASVDRLEKVQAQGLLF